MTLTQTTLRRLAAAAAIATLAACSGPLLTNDAAGSGPADNSPQAQAVHGRAMTGQFQ